MKNLITLSCILLFSICGYGQTSKVDECGLDDLSTLNKFEAAYFNEVFDKRTQKFDFDGKVVAYFTGSSGKTIGSKSGYFNNVRNGESGVEDVHIWQAESTQILILSESEKALSGGYDVIIVYWSMISVDGKRKAKLIKKLKKYPPILV